MRKRFKYPLTFVGILLCIFLALGICYIFYDKFVFDAIVLVDDNLSINFINGNKFDQKHNTELKFTIVNNGTENINYYISFNEIKGSANYNLKCSENDINIKSDLTSGVVSSYIDIKPGEVQNYTLILDSVSNYSGKINVNVEAKNETLFADVLLLNNKVSENSKTELGQSSLTDEGLIQMQDDRGISYYFRGAVNTNYVSFAGLMWRVVRINGDGSTRLVLNNVLDSTSSYMSGDSFKFTSSNIKDVLDDFYETTLQKYSNYIATTNYCNDLPTEDSNYVYNRVMIDKIFSLNCLSEKTSAMIGLLNIDEIITAGASLTEENRSYYLYNSSIKNDYYTMSSSKIENNVYYHFAMGINGDIKSIDGKTELGVRPVINIIKNVAVNGKGTIDEPYVIVPIESE